MKTLLSLHSVRSGSLLSIYEALISLCLKLETAKTVMNYGCISLPHGVKEFGSCFKESWIPFPFFWLLLGFKLLGFSCSHSGNCCPFHPSWFGDTVNSAYTPFKPTSPGNFPGESLQILWAGRWGKYRNTFQTYLSSPGEVAMVTRVVVTKHLQSKPFSIS